ncbi:F-box/kelch-repeat protein [Sesbania bispinosa]|nr:F-box/kelch-repeat protein [Sesbania bispinosa]
MLNLLFMGIKVNWTSGELRKWINSARRQLTLEKDLTRYKELRTKVAGLEGRVALLNQENEDLVQKNKTLSGELNQAKTNKKNVDASLLQEKANHEIKIFYPDVDTSVCDILKEVVEGVLVDLIVGESGGNAAYVEDKNVVDKEAENVDSEVGVVETELVEEVLGIALCN